jgi:hypothetical protein
LPKNKTPSPTTQEALLSADQPVTINDSALSIVAQMARTLTPLSASLWLKELAIALRSEPIQPVDDGAVVRKARELLKTGRFKRCSDLVVQDGAHHQEPKHYTPHNKRV